MAQNLFSRRRQTKRKQKGKRHNSEFFDDHDSASGLRVCEVAKLSHEGRGLAKHNGKTQFIEGALIGETVSAKLLHSHNTYDELQTVEILKSSPDRIEPFCQHFALCGGCSLQNMTPQSQLLHKQTVLAEQLSHFGGIEPSQSLRAIESKPQAYRSKARLGVYFDSSLNKLVIGFREKQSKRLTEITECPILVPEIARLVPLLRTLIVSLDQAKSITHIELAASDAEQAIVIRHIKVLTDLDRSKLIDFSRKEGVRLFLQGESDMPALELSESADDLLYAINLAEVQTELKESMDKQKSIQLAFHPQDFTQVNTSVNQALILHALTQLKLNKDDRVLDLFCGLGNFTLPIAMNCGEVVGVEGSEEMVIRAKRNAQRNSIGNAEFFSADLHADFRNTPWAKQHFTKVLIDPPRAGALVVANYLHHFNAERIVYISCNPATLARDAGVLSTHGYRLETSGVIDMFPNTAHIESIAVFVRQTK